jgi:chromosome segregation ATPase
MENDSQLDDKKPLRNLHTALWIVVTLLIFALVAAFSFWARSNKYENETAKMVSDITRMDSTRTALEGTLVSLEGSYNEKISENELLTATLQERVKEVEELQDRIRRVRAQLAKSQEINEEINARLIQLEELKVSLENDIATLQGQNEELRAANNEIATELTLSKEQISALTEDVKKLDQKNEALIARLFQLAPAGYVANNFKVTAVRKNDRLTAKAGRANEIRVSFDLNDVPEQYQRQEELYLVITKFDGNPVNELQTRNIQVKSASPINIAAVDIEQRTLKPLQSVEMSFSPGRKFEAGLYNALVYAGHGFLGATSFELH